MRRVMVPEFPLLLSSPSPEGEGVAGARRAPAGKCVGAHRAPASGFFRPPAFALRAMQRASPLRWAEPTAGRSAGGLLAGAGRGTGLRCPAGQVTPAGASKRG